MALAWEHRMARSAVRNRRGAWTTYGAGGSWESVLFQAPGQDPLEVLGQLQYVSSVERDVTREVYSGDFIEPDGGWMLVVHSKYQDWVWLVGTHSLLRSLMEDSPGRWLRTGAQNTSGAIYVEVREHGKRTLFLSSDGVAWDEDEDEDDNDGFLEFESDEYDQDWPLEYETLDDVHQQLIIDLDAYVPDCFWNDGLKAMQDDALKPQYVARIDLITFGGRFKTLSPGREKQARRLRSELQQAIVEHDLQQVESVLAQNPDLSLMPKNSMTALGFAAFCVNAHFPQSVEILKRILAAGADPNDGGVKQPSPLGHLCENSFVMPLDRFELLKTLKKSGADIHQPSSFRWGTSGERSLLSYSLEQRKLSLSLWLLNHGATGVDEEQIRDSLKHLAELKLKEIDKNSEIPPPRGLVKGLERLKDGDLDKYPTLNFATKLANWEQDLMTVQRDGLASLSQAIPKMMDKIVKATRGEKPKRKRKKKESTAHFQPTRKEIEALPETITLKPVKRLSWKDKKLQQKFQDTFVQRRFEPIGLFKDEAQNHYLAAFLHKQEKLYGVIEQIGDYVFGYSVLCYSLNRGRRIRCVVSIDDDVLQSDYIEDFFMELAIASPIESIVSQLFDYDDCMDNKRRAMEVDAESFPDLYTQVYRQFRKNFLKTFE